MSASTNTDLGLTLVLGTEYEKKKQKLLEELQLDLKDHIAKETLKDERKKECDTFLQEKYQTAKLKNSPSALTPKSDAVKLTSHGTPSTFPTTPTNTISFYNEHPSSRREVATLTECTERRRSRRNQSPLRRRYSPREFYSSEEITSDEEDDYHYRHRWRQDRSSQRPKYKEKRRYREYRTNRSFEDMMRMHVNKESPVAHDENLNKSAVESDSKQTPESIKTAGMQDFTTGLQIGAVEDETVTLMKKEQYKTELLRQIAEQQKNKMKEKELEMRVAVTGATDPEKQPDRIKQLGATYPLSRNRRRFKEDSDASAEDLKPVLKEEKPPEIPEQRLPRWRSLVDFGHPPSNTSPQSGMLAVPTVSPHGYLREDYHRNPAALLEDVHVPRYPGVAPTLPPIVPNAYRTPFDAASYYQYGPRSALDPNLQNYQSPPMPVGMQHFANFEMSPQKPPLIGANVHGEYVSGIGSKEPRWSFENPHTHTPNSKNQLSYQEALKQQIKERDISKQREKEEENNCKMMSQMKTYNPWGKSGGGAPIRDENGNIVSDLNQLRRIGNIMNTAEDCDDRLNSQRVLAQNRYKEELKKQMEDNRRKQAEEQQRLRIEDEEEEKRLLKERERLRQEYEEEVRQQKELMNKSRAFKPRPEPERKVEVVEQRKEMSPEDAKTTTEKIPQNFYENVSCPPITTHQEKMTNVINSRPCSSTSQLSLRTRSVSAPLGRPLPVCLPPLNKGQEEVIKELSALRQYLRREQRQLELQQGLTDPGLSQLPRLEVFGSANKEALRSRSMSRHLKDFNELMYRRTSANSAQPDVERIGQQRSSESTRDHQKMLRRRQISEVNNCGDQTQLASNVHESHYYNRHHSSQPDSVHGDYSNSSEKAIH